MDPDPVAKPTQIMGEKYPPPPNIFYFHTNRTTFSDQQKTNVYCEGNIIWRGGIICHTLIFLVSPSIEYYMSVLQLNINRLT